MRDELTAKADHTLAEVMAAFVAGTCSPEECNTVKEHCIVCGECRAKLSILLLVCNREESNEDEKRLKSLFPLGVEAASLAKWQLSDSEIDVWSEEKISAPEPLPAKPAQSPVEGPIIRHHNYRAYLASGVALAALLTVGLLGYSFFRAHQRVEDGLAALRLVHRQNRPLEARVTGGFTYQPYQRSRGGSERSEIDRDQLNYALAELTRAVASNPTTEARHALGRLCLLIGDFDRAEEQLELAVRGAPNNAKLHTDLATLNFERSKYADQSSRLAKAVQHFNSAIELDPNLAEAWFNRALCHDQMNLYAEARADWERYLQLDPDSPWSIEVRERLSKLQKQISR
jgi:tetratricopeptide (TPR) repeat protein